MKIGFLSYFNLRAGEGYEHWLRDVYGRLGRRNEIKIITSDVGPRRWSLEDEFTGAEIREFPFRKAFFNPFSAEAAEVRALFRDSDVVYSVYFTATRLSLALDLMLLTLRSRYGTHVVMGHHNPNDWFMHDRTLTAKTGILLGRRIAHHHALNNEMKVELEAHGVRRVHKIPNGIETSEFRTGSKAEKFRMLYVGSLDKRKGADLIPFFFESTQKQIQEAELAIAGDGTLTHTIRNAADNGHLRWMGFVDEPTKRELYTESHVFIAPSQRETFMLTGLEAMASGTPVVTFDIPGPREYVVNGYNGYLVRTIDEMVEKVKLIHDAWKRGDESYWEMCRNARKTAKRFDWEVIIPELEGMLREVAEE